MQSESVVWQPLKNYKNNDVCITYTIKGLIAFKETK